MSELVRQKKYQFTSSVKLPNLEEIIEAASDFSTPTEKKILVSEKPSDKKDIKEITKKVNLSKEQLELQKLGIEIADAEIKRAKEKELARAAELRRLCQEREKMAQKRIDEENAKQKAAEDAAKAKAFEKVAKARAEAARVQAEEEERKAINEEAAFHALDQYQMPPILPDQGETAAEKTYDVSEVAENPFDERVKQVKKAPAEKKEFKETILQDDFQEEMEFLDDTSESVDDLDF